jgi:hypothetical protein
MKSKRFLTAAVMSWCYLSAGLAWAGEAEPPPENLGVVILDTSSYWRCHVTLRPSLWGAVAKPEPRDQDDRKIWKSQARNSLAADQSWPGSVKCIAMAHGQPQILGNRVRPASTPRHIHCRGSLPGITEVV